MAATDNQPVNQNFLSPLGFTFIMTRSPHLMYFCQAITIPAISLGRSDVPSPFVKIPFAGDHLDFSDLVLTFKVDEDLKNYLEIFNWMNALGFPESFDQYKALDQKPLITGEKQYSDIEVNVLTSKKNFNNKFIFKEAFPTNLSELTLDSTQPDVEFLTATVIFTYKNFVVNP